MTSGHSLNRRQLLGAGLALPFALGGAAHGADVIPIADMHFHLFFPGIIPGRNGPMKPLARTMAEGGISLLSWSLVGDLPWLRTGPRGLVQAGAPQPGAAMAWFEEETSRVRAHLDQQGLKTALTTSDIDAALKGEPRVVISVEGATFLDESTDNLRRAYDLGLRHLQLVHYIQNEIGDFQTERPHFHGLTARGKEIVAACNSLGILIDLAHATPPVVQQVLDISKAPVIWSHSSIAVHHKAAWTLPIPRARHLNLDVARDIADKGGVIGLWAMSSDVGPNPQSYARKLAEMADLVGEDHVAIGTDSGALVAPALASAADVRRAVDHLSVLGLPRSRVEKLAIGNYARVLKAALAV